MADRQTIMKAAAERAKKAGYDWNDVGLPNAFDAEKKKKEQEASVAPFFKGNATSSNPTGAATAHTTQATGTPATSTASKIQQIFSKLKKRKS